MFYLTAFRLLHQATNLINFLLRESFNEPRTFNILQTARALVISAAFINFRETLKILMTKLLFREM